MKIKKIDGKSRNPQKELGELLKKNFPEIFAEGRVDCQKLKRTLGEDVESNGERYGLSWAGKGDCFRHIQEPTTKTLKPAKGESVDFENTGNLFIEGENLEVLKVLQKSYYGKIKCIYIDPPYNTGNDSFIYPDRFQESQDEYLRRIGDKDEEGNLTKEGMFRKNSKDGGHYHSNWLSMMYPRLFLARNLLRQDGVIFVSIDDNEVHNLRMIMNEIFGEENFIAQLVWKSKSGGANDSRYVATDQEYLLCYSRNFEELEILKDSGADVSTLYNFKDENGKYALDRLDKQSIRYSPSLDYEIIGLDGKSYFPKHKNPSKPNATWRWGRNTVKERFSELVFKNGNIYTKNYEKDAVIPRTLLLDERFGRTRTGKTDFTSLFDTDYFSSPKPVKLIKYLCEISTKENDIILDFFAGSGTTGHAVMAQNVEDGGNRKFICVQMPELCDKESEAHKAGYKNIADIAKERIRRSGAKIKKENGSKLNFENKKLDSGFKVFKLDDSNFKIWNGNVKDPEELEKQMLEFVDNVKKESTAENMLYELLLKSGLDPNVSVEKKKANGGSYYSVDDGKLIVHLEGKITKELVEEILKAKPEKMVCLDRAFGGNDQLKTNTALSMESAKIDFRAV